MILTSAQSTGTQAYHAGHTPDVSWRTVVTTQQNLQRAVLSGLDLLAEVLVLKKEYHCQHICDYKAS